MSREKRKFCCLKKKSYKFLRQQNTSGQAVYDRVEECNFKNVLFFFFNKVLVFFPVLSILS